MRYPQIIVTGDSIAQQSFKQGGYGAVLTDEYHGKLDVLNRGMGGWNTKQLLQYLVSDMDLSAAADVRLFIIHIGNNDSTIDALQTVPLDEYKANLRSIVANIRARWSRAGIILLTPSTLNVPKIEAFDTALGLPDNLLHRRRPENTKRYAAGCVSVGHEIGVPVIDIFALHTRAIDEGTSLDELYNDGLHYTPYGYSIVNAELRRTIRTIWPDLRPAAMADSFPCFASYANEHDPRSVGMSDFIKRFNQEALRDDLGRERTSGMVNGQSGGLKVPEAEAGGAAVRVL